MKKLTAGVLTVLTSFLIVGCGGDEKPSEEPKELFLTTYKNTLESTSFNYDINFDFEFKDKEESNAIKTLDQSTYQFSGALNKQEQLLENRVQIEIPEIELFIFGEFRGKDVKIDVPFLIDGKNKKVNIDGEKFSSTAENLMVGFDLYNEETEKMLSQLKSVLEDKIIEYPYYGDFEQEENFLTVWFANAASHNFLRYIPEEKFVYLDTEKGSKGVVEISLTDAEIKDYFENYLVEEKGYTVEDLTYYNEYMEDISFNGFQLITVVNDKDLPIRNELVVKIDYPYTIYGSEETEKRNEVTLSIDVDYDHFNDETYFIDHKNGEIITFEELDEKMQNVLY